MISRKNEFRIFTNFGFIEIIFDEKGGGGTLSIIKFKSDNNFEYY